MPDDKGNPTAEEAEAARKTEFNKWIAEFLGQQSDPAPSTGPASTSPAPPASSGLTLEDVAKFLDNREKQRKDGGRLDDIERSLKELSDKVAAGPQRKKGWASILDF